MGGISIHEKTGRHEAPPGFKCGVSLLAVLGELGVEDDLRRWEIQLLDEGGGFGGSKFAVHGTIFPLDAQGATVFDVVEGTDDLLEVDVSTTHGLEVPVTAGFVEIHVTAEDASVHTQIRSLNL